MNKEQKENLKELLSVVRHTERAEVNIKNCGLCFAGHYFRAKTLTKRQDYDENPMKACMREFDMTELEVNRVFGFQRPVNTLSYDQSFEALKEIARDRGLIVI